jgi:type II secretory pathway pseudopilin PulG
MENKSAYRGQEKGFSLLELALVFLATGFLMVLGARFLTIYTVQARQDTINDRLENIKDALYEYYLVTGRYPCPARLTAAPGDADYGRQQCRPAIIANDCVTGVPAGVFCSNVLARDADNDGFNDTVLIGAVPVLDIIDIINSSPFTFKDSIDAMNMRFTYAVTESMSDPTLDLVEPANAYLGAIRIQDDNSTEVLDPPASAHYVVVSHGDNMEGAYMEDGNRFASCVNAAILPPIPPPDTSPGSETALPPGSNIGNMAVEKENCDLNDALFTIAPRLSII